MDSLLHPGNCDAFFYGETHTRYFEPVFKLHLVKMLHSEQGIRDVFMEMGFAPAVVFNKFLETGDTSLIRIKVLYTTPYYMEFWKQLYRYNKDLPEHKKIRVHGVDFEATTAFFHALLLLVPDQAQIPESLDAAFQKLRAYSAKEAMNPKEFTESVKEIKSAFHAHHDQISKLYGDNYRMVGKIFDNDITMTDKLRDKKMYRHMQTILTENNITRFLGFFGGDHINYEYKTSLPDQLIGDGMLKDKVLTIRGVYFDAFDNWSRETVECIGVYDEKDGHTLHERYRDSSCRAILVPSGFKDDILKNSADFYLFVDDKARP
ncbi:MAG: hypothetical protein QM743_00710 [Chitinophagaceae bacterium]